MKTKILVGILVIAIVIFGVLFGMKLMSNEDTKETDGNVELTLITCSDYSSTRIIVKARTMGTEHSFEISNKGDTPQ